MMSTRLALCDASDVASDALSTIYDVNAFMARVAGYRRSSSIAAHQICAGYLTGFADALQTLKPVIRAFRNDIDDLADNNDNLNNSRTMLEASAVRNIGARAWDLVQRLFRLAGVFELTFRNMWDEDDAVEDIAVSFVIVLERFLHCSSLCRTALEGGEWLNGPAVI